MPDNRALRRGSNITSFHATPSGMITLDWFHVLAAGFTMADVSRQMP